MRTNVSPCITEEILKGEARYNIQGLFNIVDDTTLEVHELPLRSWTNDYKEFLESLMSPDKVKDKNAVPFITDFKAGADTRPLLSST
jgi:hypothetical protein